MHIVFHTQQFVNIDLQGGRKKLAPFLYAWIS